MNSGLGDSCLVTCGGRILCRQCNALSKRTGLQCRAPATAGKVKCRFHGGRSTGPTSEAGRRRCAESKTIHGRETRKQRQQRSVELAELALLETLGFALGIITGKKSAGPKPKLLQIIVVAETD